MPKTITLTDEEVKQVNDISSFGTNYHYDLLQSKLRQTDQELRLIVLKGLWLPKRDEFYKPVDKRTGEIKGKDKAAFNFHLTTNEAYAPPELAEELSQVIQGKWKPTKEYEGYKFFCIDTTSKLYEWRNGFNYNGCEGDLYFFTEPQRATFIASIEKAKGTFAEFSFGTDGRIYFDWGADNEGENTYQNDTTKALNSLLTWARSQGYKG